MNNAHIRAFKIGIITLAFAVLPSFAATGYLMRVFTLLVIFSLFTLSMNIVFGHTDQLYLFVGGLAGIGAYTTVVSANTFGLSPWVTLIFGIAAAGIIGGIVSYIAAKRHFSVILIAVFTLTLQLAIMQFFIGARSITGGSTGLPVEAVMIEQRMVLYYVFVGILFLFLVLYDRLIHSRYGIAFNSIREDELAAESVGIDVVRCKTIAGLLSAMMIGLVGSLYGFSEGYLTPSIFSFQNIDVMILIMLTLGGMRTMVGPIVGTVFIMALEEYLAGSSEWRLIIFGTLLIVLFLYFREGIIPKISDAIKESSVATGSVIGRLT